MEKLYDRRHFDVYFCWVLYKCDAGIVAWVLGIVATKYQLINFTKSTSFHPFRIKNSIESYL